MELLTKQILWCIFYGICFLISVILLVHVVKKSKEIKDIVKYLCYCRISDWILKITGLNLILSMGYYVFISYHNFELQSCIAKPKWDGKNCGIWNMIGWNY